MSTKLSVYNDPQGDRRYKAVSANGKLFDNTHEGFSGDSGLIHNLQLGINARLAVIAALQGKPIDKAYEVSIEPAVRAVRTASVAVESPPSEPEKEMPPPEPEKRKRRKANTVPSNED